MSTFVFILMCAAITGAVIWNHRNRDAALDGVEFSVAASSASVAAAIFGLYSGGVKAKAKSALSGVRVTQIGPTAFRFESRIGDVGAISINGDGTSATVRARTVQLYVGTHPISHFRSGLAATAGVLAHRIYRLLRIAPNAGKMKRFQFGLEDSVGKQLSRASR